MDGLFLPAEEMLLSQCWGDRRCTKGLTLPKGTEWDVLVGGKGMAMIKNQ